MLNSACRRSWAGYDDREAMSPTERSLAFLRGRGYLVAVVEKWNPHVKIRQDLFGVLDLLAVKPGEILGVQTTTGDNMSKRITKFAESDLVPRLRESGMRLEVHGWRKLASGKWEPRVEDVS